jgi:hypothetical protein
MNNVENFTLQEIRDLIAKDKISLVINKLSNSTDVDVRNIAINFSSRFLSLKREKGLGVLSTENYSTRKNSLVLNILDYVNSIFDEDVEISQKECEEIPPTTLDDIYKYYFNHDEEYAKEIFLHMKNLSDHEFNSRLNKDFDTYGRKLSFLKLRSDKITEKYNKDLTLSPEAIKKTSLEEALVYISEPCPAFGNLKECLLICLKFGFTSNWVSAAVDNQIGDEFQRIDIANELENFINSTLTNIQYENPK